MADAGLGPTSSDLLLFDDAVWEDLAKSTNAGLCYQCGTCTATCPLADVSPFRVRRMIRQAQYGLADSGVWKCTTCAECNVSCPRGVDIVGLVRHVRKKEWKRRTIPAGLPSLMWAMHADGNPFRLPPRQRAAWSRGLQVPIPDTGETLLYVGCAGAYDPRAQRIARAVATLLGRAGVPYRIFGEQEVCCGETARALGQEGLFADLQAKNAASFKAAGIREVVTVSPHCFDALRVGQAKEGGVEVLHYTQALERLLDSGKLAVGVTGEGKVDVTYHDPCYLGRQHGVYEPPRRLLELAGHRLVEMSRTKSGARCCGGGGGRMWMETPPQERIADDRVREANGTGSPLLATTCPYCIACFEDSVKGQKLPLRVLDVAEILAGPPGVRP